MINIDSFYKSVLDFLNKNNGQYVSPAEFNRVVRLASLDYFKELYGGKTLPKNQYGKNRVLDDRLNPFRKEGVLTFTSGVAPKPSNIEFIRSISVTVGGKPKRVRRVEELRFDDSFDNPLADGIVEDPICTETETSIQISPASFGTGKIKYLEKPIDPEWGYDLIGGRKPVYNASKSVDLQWDETEEPQLAMRVVNYLGFSVRDVNAMQFSEKEKQQG